MAILKETRFEFTEASAYDRVHDADGDRYTRRLEVHGIPAWDYTSNYEKKRHVTVSKTWWTHPGFLDAHDDIPYLLSREQDYDVDVWVFRAKVYLTGDRELTPEDVRALVNVEGNRCRLALEKAHALQAMTE